MTEKLVGISVAAPSASETLANIREAIEGWLEVMQSKSAPTQGELVEVTV